nr:MAG TPA: hypothetical protein [Caudoviricetes sp.]
MKPIEEQALLIKANSSRTQKLTTAQIGSKILGILYSGKNRRESLINAAAELIHQAEMEEENGT